MSFSGRPIANWSSNRRWRLTFVLVMLGHAALAADPPIQFRVIRVNEFMAHIEWEGGRAPYRMQACTDSAFTWFDISEHLFGNSYDTPCTAELTFFRVRTAEDLLPPFPPTGLGVAASRCDRLALLWERAEDDPDGSGVAGYRLYRDGSPVAEAASPRRFLLDDQNVQPESSYIYTVTCLDRLGNESLPSLPLTVVTGPCIEESAPLGQANLTWDSSETPEVSGYVVYWGLEPGNYHWAIDAMDASSAFIPELLPGTAYFFAVTAYDREGAQSDFSPERAFITP